MVFTLEEFLLNWNEEFPNHKLTADDLSNPRTFIVAVLEVLRRIGINVETILSPPPENERDKHTEYYWDLLPIINIMKVVNTFASTSTETLSIPLMNFLKPNTDTSFSILYVLFNILKFNIQRLDDLQPLEENVFMSKNEVASLTEEEKRYKELLENQTAKRASRPQRLEKMEEKLKQVLQKIKAEKEGILEDEKQLCKLTEELKQKELSVEQRKTQNRALKEELLRIKAQRVTNEDDVRAQSKEAAQNLKEVIEKLDSLKEMRLIKGNCIKNLQNVKTKLDETNLCIHEVAKLTDNLKVFETGDGDRDNDDEVRIESVKLEKAEADLAELKQKRTEVFAAHSAKQTLRQQQITLAASTANELSLKLKKKNEWAEEAIAEVERIKSGTLAYNEQCIEYTKMYDNIKNGYFSELKNLEVELSKQLENTLKFVKDQMKNNKKN